MSITHFTGADKATYTPDQLSRNQVPDTAWPLTPHFKFVPLPPPMDVANIHSIPIDAWRDTAYFGEKFESRLIVLTPADAKTVFESLPPPRPLPTIPGYQLIIHGDQYFFEGECPCCGTKLSRITNNFGDTEDDGSWTHHYGCAGCGCLTTVQEGDKNGGAGQFDHFDTFKPVGKP